MTISKYTLVHYSPEGRKLLGKKADAGRVGTKALTKATDCSKMVKGAKKAALRTSAPNPSRRNFRRCTGARKAGQVQPTQLTVGIWDLGAWLSNLSQLVETFNRAQTTIVFYEVKAMVPAGMISRPERMTSWLTDNLERKLKAAEKKRLSITLLRTTFLHSPSQFDKTSAPIM